MRTKDKILHAFDPLRDIDIDSEAARRRLFLEVAVDFRDLFERLVVVLEKLAKEVDEDEGG